MKLAPLLKQFLYKNKKLNLQKIGTFLLNETLVQHPENSKQPDEFQFEVIYEYNPAMGEDPELIEFISEHTGKMKALASSDLSSFLEISIQFLNIGKKFKLEGIGTLIKTQQNDYAFTPERLITEKAIEMSKKGLKNKEHAEENFDDFDTLNPEANKPSFTFRSFIFLILSLGGLGMIIWGIYYINTNKEEDNTNNSKIKSAIIPITEDTASMQKAKPDSAAVPKYNIEPGTYKFVLETSDKTRAFDRYAQLKSYNWDIRMETKDSILYTLFVLIPATPADTSRLIDSMKILSGNNVKIERQ